MPAATKEVVAQPSNQEVVLAEAVVEAEGPLVVQAAPADEILSAPSPPPAAPERLPGGSPNAPPVSEQPAEGTAGEPSTSERLPEETVGGSPGPSPSRPTGVLVVVRTPPCEVPEANSWSGPQPIRASSSSSMSRRMTLSWRRSRNLFLLVPLVSSS